MTSHGPEGESLAIFLSIWGFFWRFLRLSVASVLLAFPLTSTLRPPERFTREEN